MPLKLNGEPFSLHRVRPTVLALRTFLDKSPADEIFTTEVLSQKTKIPTNTFHASSSSPVHELPEYTHRIGNTRYWGNPRAIKELRRQIEAEQ